MEEKKNGGSFLWLLAIVAVIWFVFSKNTSKPWVGVEKTALMSVQYCESGNCSQYYTLQVENIGKSATKGEWIFELEWPNGGLQEASVSCGKDDIGRFCSGIGDGGRLFRFRQIKD